VFEHIAEELEILDLIVAPDGAALHSRTKFTTIKDWPDFELWPTMVGDVRVVESINMYRTAERQDREDPVGAVFEQMSAIGHEASAPRRSACHASEPIPLVILNLFQDPSAPRRGRGSARSPPRAPSWAANRRAPPGGEMGPQTSSG
jgi:hypothetical protein